MVVVDHHDGGWPTWWWWLTYMVVVFYHGGGWWWWLTTMVVVIYRLRGGLPPWWWWLTTMVVYTCGDSYVYLWIFCWSSSIILTEYFFTDIVEDGFFNLSLRNGSHDVDSILVEIQALSILGWHLEYLLFNWYIFSKVFELLLRLWVNYLRDLLLFLVFVTLYLSHRSHLSDICIVKWTTLFTEYSVKMIKQGFVESVLDWTLCIGDDLEPFVISR